MNTLEHEQSAEGLPFNEVINLTDEMLEIAKTEWNPNSLHTGEVKPLHWLYTGDRYVLEAAVKSIGLDNNAFSSLTFLLGIQSREASRQWRIDHSPIEEDLPKSAFKRWLKSRRDSLNIIEKNVFEPSDIVKESASKIQIVEPLTLSDAKRRVKTWPGSLDISASKIQFEGTFMYEGQLFNLADSGPIIDIKKYVFDSGDFNARPHTLGKEHYLLLPKVGKVFSDESLNPLSSYSERKDGEASMAINSAISVLQTMKTSEGIRPQ